MGEGHRKSGAQPGQTGNFPESRAFRGRRSLDEAAFISARAMSLRYRDRPAPTLYVRPMLLRSPRSSMLLLLLCASAAVPRAAAAADCENTGTGRVPLTDLGAGLYLGAYQGGLYAGGSNAVPNDHRQAGLARAAAVEPRDGTGAPAADGRIGLISIGMSNTTMEWCAVAGLDCTAWSFTGIAEADPAVEHEHLVIVNGAASGQTAPTWTDPDASNYDWIRDVVLPVYGMTPAQVQVAWVKLANPNPTAELPSPSADAFVLEDRLGDVLRALRVNYPNLQLVFLSSRIYAGYTTYSLNPEPHAYEAGFAMKWVIDAQIQQMRGLGTDATAGDLDYASGVAPWVAWGPYLWADGLTPRSDGLTWECSDLASDGVHPSNAGQAKVAELLLDFMLGSEFTAPWFRVPEPAGGALAALAALGARYAQSRGRRKSVYSCASGVPGSGFQS